MRLRISIRGRVRPSVGPSVGWSVPSYFRTPNMAVFEGKKSSNDILNDGIMSDDEVVASDVPPRYLFIWIKYFDSGIKCLDSFNSSTNLKTI